MFRKIAVFAVTVMIAGSLLAEGNENPGGGKRISIGQGAAPQRIVTSDANGEGAYRGTLDRLNTNTSGWVYSGRLPEVYKLAGLTDEQRTSMEALCKEARDKMMQMNKEVAYRTNHDPKFWQEQSAKIQALMKEYEEKIQDILTDEQKATLKKIQDLIKEQQDKSNEIYQEAHKKVMEMKKQYEVKLGEELTPEQKKALDELMNPKPVPPAPVGGQGKPGEVVAF